MSSESITMVGQVVLVILALLLGIGTSRLMLRSNTLKRIQNVIPGWARNALVPIMDALCFLFWFLIAFLIAGAFIHATHILLLGAQMGLLMIGCMMLRNITERMLLLVMVWVIGAIALVSNHVGQLGQLIELVNAVGIQLGSIRLTPLAFVKGVVLLVVLSWGASNTVDWSTQYIKRNAPLKSNTKALLSKSVEVLIYFFAFMVALSFLGIDLTAFTVLGGALGVGIGFGLQKTTSNFISGIILLLEKSIETDDLIEMDGGIYGFIRQINARYTLIETFDGKEIMVPNEDFMTHRVTNWTFSNSKGRIEIPVGVSYNADIKKAQALILEAATEHPRTINDPKPECYLTEFGDSSVNFLLYFFVGDVTEGRYQPQSEVMMAIWDKFKANNIEIPFPQRDVHIKTRDSL